MFPARITAVTLGARDLPALRDFYERVGWELVVDLPDFAVFGTRGAVLLLFGLDDLAADAQLPAAPPQEGLRTSTLCVNVESRELVDEAIATVRAAGATITKEPVETDFGGYSSYFADPEGNVWEVVWVPPDSAMHAAIERAGGFGELERATRG